jgi:ABC-type nickel/cobalt efflux system permease component RcnA
LVDIPQIYPAIRNSVGDFRPGTRYNAAVLTPILMAILLGLRHATDPDHLTAVSTLLLNENQGGHRRAALLALSWGLGHGTTLVVFGIPVVLFSRFLTEPLQQSAEVLIGLVIVALAARLLVRWRRGYFHAHPHNHGSILHIHPHVHEHASAQEHPIHHSHAHAERLGGSPVQSFGIGLLHGIGGSAGAAVLLMSAVGGRAEGVLALFVFAAATAGSMALLSMGLAYMLARRGIRHRLSDLVPVIGTAGVIFGAWYSLGALQGWS